MQGSSQLPLLLLLQHVLPDTPACHVCFCTPVLLSVGQQLNLFLAVLKTKFAKAKNLLDEKRRQRRAMKIRRGSKQRNVLARATGWMKGQCVSFQTALPWLGVLLCCTRT